MYVDQRCLALQPGAPVVDVLTHLSPRNTPKWRHTAPGRHSAGRQQLPLCWPYPTNGAENGPSCPRRMLPATGGAYHETGSDDLGQRPPFSASILSS